MARWTGLPHTESVLDAAEEWRQKCFLSDGSLFTEEKLWSAANFQQLQQRFVENLLGGSESFYKKLAQQLAGAGPQVIELAAEAIWLLFLFVSQHSVSPEKKRERISEIWRLSGSAEPRGLLLSDEVLRGLANPGAAFLTQIWREMRYLILVLCGWKALATERQQQLLTSGDPWPFCEWLTSIEEGSARAFRHMLLYLCYPESFERICSRNHKRKIYDVFSGALQSGADVYREQRTPCALDKSILEIRKSLEASHKTLELDFYLEPLREKWLSEEPLPVKGEESLKGGAEPLKDTERPKFSIDDALQDLFLEREDVERMLAIWHSKKNLILQGPPGSVSRLRHAD